MKILVVIVSFLVMSGCATYSPIVQETDKETIQTLRVISLVLQEEIKVQINVQNSSAAGAQFGLLGAIVSAAIDSSVNNSRAKKSETQSDNLRNALMDVDVTKALHDAVRKGVESISWAEVTAFEIRNKFDRKDMKTLAAEMKEDAVLVVTSNYSLTPKQEFLEFESRTKFYKPKSSTSGKKGKYLLRIPKSASTLLYQSDFVTNGLNELNSKISKISKIENEYNSKAQGLSVKKLKSLKQWRRNEIKTAQSDYRKKIKAEQNTMLSQKTEKIENEHKAKLAAADNKAERSKIRSDKKAALRAAKSEVKNIVVDKRNDAWTTNSGAQLKDRIHSGLTQMALMLKTAFNSSTPSTELNKKTMKLTVGFLANESFIGTIDGYLLDITDTQNSECYMLKVAAGDQSFPNYISFPKDGKLYSKYMRN